MLNRLPLAISMIQTNPGDPRIYIGIGVVILLAIVINLIVKRVRNPGGANTGSSGSGAYRAGSGGSTKPLSHGGFIRQATSAGFSGNEAAFLEQYARQLKIINPSAIFGTAERLDAFIKAAYKTIEHYAKTEVDAEAEKAQLFAIRNAVGQRMKTGHMVQATYQLQPKLPLSMENAKGNHFATILLRNDSDGLLIEKPKDAFGDYIPFTRGSKITVFFYTGNHQGYQFKTKIQRTADSNGHLYLVLAHSQAISSLPSRQHERTTVRIPCRFFRVQVQVSGQGKSAKRLVHAENVPIAGMISDISAGGLSIQTVSPLHSAEFAKIVFDAGFGERSVFATIVRTNRLKNSFAMHVRFVKATRKTINELHALVFGYA